MDNLFDIDKDGQPIINPQALFIPELRKIWDEDKTKDKYKASCILRYVYHIADTKSVYSNLPETSKEYTIKKDCDLAEWEPDSNTIAAVIKYKELTETVSLRYLKAISLTLDKLATYLNDTIITGGKGGNISQVLSAIKQGEAMLTSYSKLREQVQREVSLNRKLKGKTRPNIFDNEE